MEPFDLKTATHGPAWFITLTGALLARFFSATLFRVSLEPNHPEPPAALDDPVAHHPHIVPDGHGEVPNRCQRNSCSGHRDLVTILNVMLLVQFL